jgi:hypothetical protein
MDVIWHVASWLDVLQFASALQAGWEDFALEIEVHAEMLAEWGEHYDEASGMLLDMPVRGLLRLPGVGELDLGRDDLGYPNLALFFYVNEASGHCHILAVVPDGADYLSNNLSELQSRLADVFRQCGVCRP